MKCKNCNWKGSKYELLISMNGDCCPQCLAEMTNPEYIGFTHILEKQPEEPGMYIKKGDGFEVATILSTNQSGEKVWVNATSLSERQLFTHWKKNHSHLTNLNNTTYMPVDSKLKPEELRIGNRIMYSDGMNVVLGIQSPSPQKEPYLSGKYLVEINPPDSFYVPIEDLEPIPLTKEMLEKIGFKLITVHDFHCYQLESNKFSLCMWMGEKPVAGFEKKGMCYAGDNYTEIPSVHWLQNYFYFVFRKELTIQL